MAVSTNTPALGFESFATASNSDLPPLEGLSDEARVRHPAEAIFAEARTDEILKNLADTFYKEVSELVKKDREDVAESASAPSLANPSDKPVPLDVKI